MTSPELVPAAGSVESGDFPSVRKPDGGQSTGSSTDAINAINAVIRSFRSPVVRAYSRVRFTILRQTFLEEIGQYLPRRGEVLDFGCGFGLFSLFYAITRPGLRIRAVDLDSKRIAAARESAARLNLTNVSYVASDATKWTTDEQFDAIYMLDLLHHLPSATVPQFLEDVSRLLRRSGILIIKDVADRPRYKMLFTLMLDRLLVGADPIRYWPPSEMTSLLAALGFDVVRHRMNDILPYPHILYVCRRRAD